MIISKMYDFTAKLLKNRVELVMNITLASNIELKNGVNRLISDIEHLMMKNVESINV